jgi:1-acylglycerol-3-phosphate O-acyltransferase
MLRAFLPPQQSPHPNAKLYDLETVLANYPNRVIVVFPECTTSNGRGVLPLSPGLLTTPPNTKVFPVHLRYTAADITTPIPGAFFTFFWNLCSKPTHCIRIRIAEAVQNSSRATSIAKTTSFNTNYLDMMADGTGSDADTLVGSEELEGPVTKEEKAFLDKIGEALARLGRVKRVGLGVKEKEDFIASWTKARKQ